MKANMPHHTNWTTCSICSAQQQRTWREFRIVGLIAKLLPAPGDELHSCKPFLRECNAQTLRRFGHATTQTGIKKRVAHQPQAQARRVDVRDVRVGSHSHVLLDAVCARGSRMSTVQPRPGALCSTTVPALCSTKP